MTHHRITDEAPLSFTRLKSLADYATHYAQLDDDYIIAYIDSERGLPPLSRPVRIDGWMVIVCLEGSVELEIDLKTCTLHRDSVACVGLDNIIRLHAETARDLRAYIIILSPSFMRDVNIDLNIINISAMAKAKSVAPAPLTVSAEDAQLLSSTVELIHRHTLTQASPHYKRSIVKSMVGALLYHLMMIGDSLASTVEGEQFATPSTRRSLYVQRFMELVQRHHCTHRNISFYAEKLFISPKYLSLIIKESTGRSAGRWIDEMVILEAKNMLRFSGKNIQQVAYELHFCNQSAFGKYFKHLTGFSPSEYQKS